MALTPGDRVVERSGKSERSGEVLVVGGCGWSGCRYGVKCVTIRFDDGWTTENRPDDRLVPA